MPHTRDCTGGVGLGLCGHLISVQLGENRFSGNLPLFLARSLLVTELLVTNNSLSGSISSQLACSLRNLRLDGNRFSGSLPWGNRSVLKVPLTLATIKMGSFQTCPLFGPTMAQLSVLSVSSNRLSGTVPLNHCDLGMMNFTLERTILDMLNMATYYPPGSVPICSNARRWLKQLQLDDNRISGTVNFNSPAYPNNTGASWDWLLAHNNTGTSWDWLNGPNKTEFPNLNLINYGNSLLSGTIPALPSSMQVLILKENSFSGTIAAGLSALRNLTNLILSGNRLSGSTVPEFRNWVLLKTLALYSNAHLDFDLELLTIWPDIRFVLLQNCSIRGHLANNGSAKIETV